MAGVPENIKICIERRYFHLTFSLNSCVSLQNGIQKGTFVKKIIFKKLFYVNFFFFCYSSRLVHAIQRYNQIRAQFQVNENYTITFYYH